MDPAGGRDFFISYTGANRTWAEWIAVQLAAAGYTTVLQSFDFAAGSDFVHQMHLATQKSARTIAVLSPAYFASEFSESEWRVAFAKDPSGDDGLLLPVRVQPCEPPGLLATRVYVDLVDADETTCRQRLLDAVTRNQVRPTEVPFPGVMSDAADPTPPGTRFPGEGPAISNLPPRNRHFAGRDAQLARMHAEFRANPMTAVVPTEAIYGLGGIGKTQLVAEYAHRFGSDYDIAWWIPAQESVTATTALVALALRLGILDAADSAQMVTDLFEQLRGQDRWLLVYDNAEDPDQLAGLLPTGGGGHVLVTSRWQGWGRVAIPLGLPALSRSESVAFLRGRLRIDDPGLESLADLLGDLPLALEEAAAYLEETGDGVANYLRLLRDRGRELLSLAPGDRDRDRRRVGTVWSLSLDRAREQEPAAEALLNLCAFLAPDIPRALPTEAPDALPDDLATMVRDPLAYNRVLAAIKRYSLATVTPTTIGVHRLVQAVVQARLDPAVESEWTGTAAALLSKRFPDDSGETATWTECERLLPQVLAVAGHAERLAVAGKDAGWLLDRGSTYLRGRGQYHQARPLAERSVGLTETALGPDHPDVAWRRDEFARVLRALGDRQGARRQYEQILEIGAATLDPNHRDVGVWRGGYGGVLQDLGDLPGARAQLEEGLRISLAALGPGHPEIGTWRNNLGSVLQDLNDLPGARAHYEEAIRIGLAHLGPDHPDIGIRRNNLGDVLRELGELPAARTQLEEALRISRNALGPDHPDIAIRHNNLGRVLRELGRPSDARAEFDEALRVGLAALGPDHPEIALWRNNLGDVLRELGELPAARTQLEEALRISLAAVGPDHATTVDIRRNLASLPTEP